MTAPQSPAGQTAAPLVDLPFYLRAIRRRWPVILALVVVGIGAVFALTPAAKKTSNAVQYTATTILLVDGNSHAASANLGQVSLLATVGDVPKLAASKLDSTESPVALARRVSVKADATTGTVEVTSTGSDARQQMLLANTFADALNQSLTATAQAKFQQSISAIQSRLNDLQNQIDRIGAQGVTSISNPVLTAQRDALVNQYRIAYDQYQTLAAQGAPTAPFDVLQRAVAVPTTSASFHAPGGRLSRSLIAAVMGLLLGIGLAIVLERVSDHLEAKRDTEEAFGRPVLAEVPRLARPDRARTVLHAVEKPAGSFAEAHRMLRTTILLMDRADEDGRGTADRRGYVVMVTSAGAGEGKTTTTANLAVAMAESGRSVLVMSCDFRNPSVHSFFGSPIAPGLTDALGGNVDAPDLRDVIRPTLLRGISVLPSGSPIDNPAEQIAASGRDLLEQVRGLADVVLIDTAPLLLVSDVAELVPLVDAVVMVARAGVTTEESGRRASELVQRLGGYLLGEVLVGASEPDGYAYSSYSYHYQEAGRGRFPWTRSSRRRKPRESSWAAMGRREGAPAGAPSGQAVQPGDSESPGSVPANGQRSSGAATVSPAGGVVPGPDEG